MADVAPFDPPASPCSHGGRGGGQAPGALHHVIIRGIERKVIFKDAKDYRNFLDRLGLILTETETPCLIEN